MSNITKNPPSCTTRRPRRTDVATSRFRPKLPVNQRVQLSQSITGPAGLPPSLLTCEQHTALIWASRAFVCQSALLLAHSGWTFTEEQWNPLGENSPMGARAPPPLVPCLRKLEMCWWGQEASSCRVEANVVCGGGELEMNFFLKNYKNKILLKPKLHLLTS